MIVRIKRMRPGAKPPEYKTAGASGFDLCAVSIPRTRGFVIEPGTSILVPCGWAFEIPEGFEGQVRPRSGMDGYGVVASLGTIDSDYRGEVMVRLRNFRAEPWPVNDGDRIAQMVIAPVSRAFLIETEELSSTARGEKGFGHTGK